MSYTAESTITSFSACHSLSHIYLTIPLKVERDLSKNDMFQKSLEIGIHISIRIRGKEGGGYDQVQNSFSLLFFFLLSFVIFDHF